MDVVCTGEEVRKKVYKLYTERIREEIEDSSSPLESRKRQLYERCAQLSSTFRTTDEEIMVHFATSLFTSPLTMLAIAQQWERMSGHTIASKELHGRGRIWTCLLHTLVSEGNLMLEMAPLCQSYSMKIYLYGMNSCPYIEALYDHGFFDKTCMDVKKRVLSPSYLRFDPEFLPTLSGRAALNLLRRRNAFQHISFRTGSGVCAVQSDLNPSLDFIFQTVFNHFRPCIVASFLIAMTWSAYKMSSSIFKERFSECIASLLVHVEERDYPEELHGRLSILRTLFESYLEKKEGEGYTLQTLENLYRDLWNEIL